MNGYGTAGTGWAAVVELPRRVLEWAAPERACIPAVLEAADLQPGTRLLDVGCGSGRLLELAAYREPGSLLTGVDSDEDSLQVARKLTRESPAPVDIRRARAEELPFSTGYFDVVTYTLVLGALDTDARARALAECTRVLRPGGRAVVADWCAPTCLPISVARAAASRLSRSLPWPLTGARASDGGPVEWLRGAALANCRREHGYWGVIGHIEVAVATKPAKKTSTTRPSRTDLTG